MLTLAPFEISAFGCPIQASASSKQGLETLDKYLFPTLPRTAAAGDTDALRIRVEEVGNRFQLLVDDVPVAEADHSAALIPYAIQHIDDRVIPKLTNLRAVHAGAVQFEDKVLLLPGSTHAGKSSMVAELLRRGATYLSDEYALIDADGLAHPYPRPLLLRNGGPDRTPLLPKDCSAGIASGPAPVGWIMELRYREGASWRIVSVPQSHALLTLLGHTPHTLAETPDLVEKFQRAVAGAQCYAGLRMEATEAAEEILRMIASRS